MLPLYMLLPSLGELERQQGTKTHSVRSAGAQGDPQSKQGSPTGESRLCPYSAHAEATAVLHLALRALGGARAVSLRLFLSMEKLQTCVLNFQPSVWGGER